MRDARLVFDQTQRPASTFGLRVQKEVVVRNARPVFDQHKDLNVMSVQWVSMVRNAHVVLYPTQESAGICVEGAAGGGEKGPRKVPKERRQEIAHA